MPAYTPTQIELAALVIGLTLSCISVGMIYWFTSWLADRKWNAILRKTSRED